MAEKETNEIERQSFTGLAKKLSGLKPDQKRAALEISAALAAVSLRVSRDFVEAVPEAAKILSADDLRNWGELGRKLAMGNAENGAAFFSAGVSDLSDVPETARQYVFQICSRQLILSSSISLESFKMIPQLSEHLKGEDDLYSNILRLAADISRRSAKHSSDFLKHSPPVIEALKSFDNKDAVSDSIFLLASDFANRTGGMTADLWANLPEAIGGLKPDEAILLAATASEMLEFGGSVTLHFVTGGSQVVRLGTEIFTAWCNLLRLIAQQGNAVLIAFLKATPKVFKQLSAIKLEGADDGSLKKNAIKHLLNLLGKIAETDGDSALAAFRACGGALKKVNLTQFEEWIESGLEELKDESAKSRRSYFALETRYSNNKLMQTISGLRLEEVSNILRLYIEALTGKTIEIMPLSEMPQESRIGDGSKIYLPSMVAEFETEEMDFRLFKVLAAHGAGQIEFGTFSQDTVELKAAYRELSSLYSSTADQIDAFSLAGYIEEVQKGDKALPDDELRKEIKRRQRALPKGSDYTTVLKVFPEPQLARKIFGTMENARVDNLLRHTYKGLRTDLDLMREHLLKRRPFIFDIPFHEVSFEILFQITMLGGATEDARRFYGQIVSEIETVVDKYFNVSALNEKMPTVADSLFATGRIYNLFLNISNDDKRQSEDEQESESESEFAYEDKEAAEGVTEDKIKREKQKETQDLRDMFNAWNLQEPESDGEDTGGSEMLGHNEMPEQPLEVGDEAFAYDEWDRELNDYRVGWSRVIEKQVRKGDRSFVELTRSRYRGVISSIRHQFQLLKPENLTRINREPDGEDYDLNALVEHVIDRRANGNQEENIYIKRLRKQRDVAVSFLLDQSSSTARTITKNPLQPYTYPGRRIIEIEKEGLVLMSEALEAVGDSYAINGFTSEGRRNVKFYKIKDFNEKYSDEVESRIGGITFQNNTRLGAAIRHAAAKLKRQENRTKLLIVLTDGRPYDHDYGDARYAREDVREALTEAKMQGIIPFCITIDRESETELRDLYGEVGYTIIDDVLSLPERMPNIYRRLTS